MSDDFAEWVVNRAKERSKNIQRKRTNFEGKKEIDLEKLDERLKSEESFDLRGTEEV